jgi:superfamily II DNA/RNA helicase
MMSDVSTPMPSDSRGVALRGDDVVVVAAETGGGKTLAYHLLPVVQRLEQHLVRLVPLDRVRLPVVVARVLTSSVELARQITAVLDELQQHELAASAKREDRSTTSQ